MHPVRGDGSRDRDQWPLAGRSGPRRISCSPPFQRLLGVCMVPAVNHGNNIRIRIDGSMAVFGDDRTQHGVSTDDGGHCLSKAVNIDCVDECLHEAVARVRVRAETVLTTNQIRSLHWSQRPLFWLGWRFDIEAISGFILGGWGVFRLGFYPAKHSREAWVRQQIAQAHANPALTADLRQQSRCLQGASP